MVMQAYLLGRAVLPHAKYIDGRHIMDIGISTARWRWAKLFDSVHSIRWGYPMNERTDEWMIEPGCPAERHAGSLVVQFDREYRR